MINLTIYDNYSTNRLLWYISLMQTTHVLNNGTHNEKKQNKKKLKKKTSLSLHIPAHILALIQKNK